MFTPVPLHVVPLSWCFGCFQGKGWAGWWVGESEALCQLILWSGACGWSNSVGREGLGQTDGCLLDCVCVLALLAVSGWRAVGASWPCSLHPGRLNPPKHQIVGGKEGKVRLAQLLTGGFPLTRSLELQTLIFEQACAGGFGLCECVWVSGADFLGNWRKEMRRLKELLLMGRGWWNEVRRRACPSSHPEVSGAAGRVGHGALADLVSSC